MEGLSLALKIRKGKKALNQSKSREVKTKNARVQANKAKTLLHTHRLRKPEHHKKVAIKAN